MFVSTLLLTALTAAAPVPWDGAPFTAAPADVAAWAAKHPAAPGTAIELLLEEATVRYDAAGRMTNGYRLVYRPLTSAAAEEWGGVGRSWHPWHEEPPVVRARTIHADGTVHVLDPKTLSQSAAHEDDPVKYSDGRVLRGPIPGIRAGDVVETETVGLETAPYFDAGRNLRFRVGGEGLPIRRIHLRIEVPATVPLRWKLLGGFPTKPVERTQAGVRILEWDLADVPATEALDDLAPPEKIPPHIAVSTGVSWTAMAAAYAARVDERIAGADLAAQAAEIAGDAKDRVEIAQRLLDWMSERARYVALELGEASIIPAKPADTLARGYGDCKDLSTLLVALLRAKGIAAQVAIVRTARHDPLDLPGLDDFDHVLVHVPGATPLWIDPTSPETPVGELPIGDQGRMALVAAPATAGLVRMPEAAPEVNRLEVEREIVMSEAGTSRATLTSRSRGYVGTLERWVARRNTPEELLKRDVGDAETLSPGSVLVTATRKGVERTREPLEIHLELARSSWGFTETDTAAATCWPDRMLWILSRRLRTDPAEAEMPKDGPLGQDVYLPARIAGDDRCVVTPPPGFQPDPLPPPLEITRGPITLQRTVQTLADGKILVHTTLLVSGRRLADREARELRRLVFPVNKSGLEIKFQRTSAVLLREGKGREALDEIRRLVALHPREARHRVHLALALRELGMGEAARAAARSAVELEPRNGWPHRVLATVLAADLLGRWNARGCDRDGAIAAQRRSAELERELVDVRPSLATYLELGTRCFRFGAGAQLEEALKIRQELRAGGDRAHEEDYLELLLELGKFEEAGALAKDSKELAESSRRQVALTTAAVVTRGGAAAARELQRLGAEERKKAIDGALEALAEVGRFAETAELLRAVNAGGRASPGVKAVAEALEGVHRGDAATLDPAIPRATVARLLRAHWLAPDEREALASVLSDELRDPQRAAFLDQALDGLLAMLRKDAPWLPAAASPELVAALLEIQEQGDEDAGYRIRVEGRGRSLTLYAAKQGKAYRVIAFEATSGLLGDHAARLVAAGKLDAARRVLGWVKASGEDSSAGRVLEVLLGSDRSAPALGLAADAVSAHRVGPRADVLDRLAKAQKSAEGERKRALTAALAEGFRESKRWQDLLDLVGSSGAWANAAFDAQAEALVGLRRPEELRAAADARLARAPGDLAALRAKRDAALLSGDAEEALRLAGKVLAASKARPSDFARAAWTAAFLDPPPDDGLQQGRRAAELTENYPNLVALAGVHAARGETADALRVLQQALDRRWGWDFGPEAWLVLGRIEAEYGLVEDAKAAYERSASAGRALPGAGAFEVEALAARWSEKL